ncbi:hypothetical protein [Burkholderia plantarii]|uniref:Uncharacterized protein n=1 Tax=Burkholderia plantarii TaxID=41899 RepID=A0A0B6S4E6_BURPL|nr:hypothetical protein [Burkholderia plantarii]AJK49264.1 hypothetical protein BGL_2c11860 [Burkholderia plantarii]
MDTPGKPASALGEGLRHSLAEARQKARELADRVEVPAALTGLTQNVASTARGIAAAGREQAGRLAQQAGGRLAGLDQEVRARLEADLRRLRDHAEQGGEKLASYFKTTFEVDKTTAQMIEEMRARRPIPAASIDDIFEQCKREAFQRTLEEFFRAPGEAAEGAAAAASEAGSGRIHVDAASGRLVIGEPAAPLAAAALPEPPVAFAPPASRSAPLAPEAGHAGLASPMAASSLDANTRRLAQQLVGLILLETIDLFIDEIHDIAVRGPFGDEHGLIAGIHARRERIASQLGSRFQEHQIRARARAIGLEGGIDGVLGAIQQILVAHLVKTPLHMLSVIRVCTRSMVRCTRVMVGDGERKFDDLRMIVGGAASGVMSIHVADAIAGGVAVVPLLNLYGEKVAAVLTEVIVTAVPLGAVYVFERNKGRFRFRAAGG